MGDGLTLRRVEVAQVRARFFELGRCHTSSVVNTDPRRSPRSRILQSLRICTVTLGQAQQTRGVAALDLRALRSGQSIRVSEPVERAPRLREVPLSEVRWADYDVVKTVFHRGVDTLIAAGGGDHPFILSKLGSVVGREPAPGVHFHGEIRQGLLATQSEVARRSRGVTILTPEWPECQEG